MMKLNAGSLTLKAGEYTAISSLILVSQLDIAMNKIIILIFVICFFGYSKDPKATTIKESIAKSGYHLSEEQKSAITSLLRSKAGWRLAIRSDCINKSLSDMLEEDSTYQPFYCEGDFNIDGSTDFAIAIIRDSITALYWFANYGSSYAKAKYLSSAKWYNDGGYGGGSDGRLGFGYFYSDVQDLFGWNKKTGEFEFTGYADDIDYDDTTSQEK